MRVFEVLFFLIFRSDLKRIFRRISKVSHFSMNLVCAQWILYHPITALSLVVALSTLKFSYLVQNVKMLKWLIVSFIVNIYIFLMHLRQNRFSKILTFSISFFQIISTSKDIHRGHTTHFLNHSRYLISIHDILVTKCQTDAITAANAGTKSLFLQSTLMPFKPLK